MIWDYATFIPALYRVLQQTEGDVVELGVGLASTPLLSAICAYCVPGRDVYSFDDDPNWINVMSSRHANENHGFRHVGLWRSAYDIVRGLEPSVVFVDHGQVERGATEAYSERKACLRYLKDMKATFVIHDISYPLFLEDNEFMELLSGFKFLEIDKHQKPWTAIASNVKEF